MKKKILALLLAVSMIAVLVACTAAHGSSSVTITTKDGAGTKSLKMSIPKNNDNGAADPDQEKFFPQGFDAVTEFLDGYITDLLGNGEVTFEELDESWDYTVSFSFTDIDDYNAKMKDLMTETYWLDIALEEVAELTAEETDGGYNVTLKESVFANKAAIAGIMSVLREEKDIFDYQYGTGNDDNKPEPNSHEDFIKVDVTVGDTTETLAVDHPTEKSLTEEGEETRFFEVTGFVSADAEPPASEEPSGEEPSGEEPVDESPATGDNGIVFMAFMLLASAVVVLSKKMVKAN